jgi:hypothetical protein
MLPSASSTRHDLHALNVTPSAAYKRARLSKEGRHKSTQTALLLNHPECQANIHNRLQSNPSMLSVLEHHAQQQHPRTRDDAAQTQLSCTHLP